MTCVSCQRHIPYSERHDALLKQLDVLEMPWESVSMDFIMKLPMTEKGNDTMFVVVDRLSKQMRLHACKESCSAQMLL